MSEKHSPLIQFIGNMLAALIVVLVTSGLVWLILRLWKSIAHLSGAA